MDYNVNFVHILNTYVDSVFTVSESREDSNDISGGQNLQEEHLDIPFFHKSAYFFFTALIVCLLIVLCALSINFKSLFMSNKSIKTAIEDLIAPNEVGYKKILHSLEHGYLQELNMSTSKSKGSMHNKTADIDIELDRLTETIKYRDIRTEFDVGSWLQFALIPSVVDGLNLYNRLLGETILLTFVRSDNEIFKYNIDKDMFKKHGTIFNSQFEVMDDNDSFDFTYKYQNDLENKHTQNASNYQYVQGNSVDEMLNSLMQGAGYLDIFPYFPLNSILSHDSTQLVSVDMLTHNVISGIISHISVGFNFTKLNNIVQGRSISDFIISKSIKISSFSISASTSCLIIYLLLLLIVILYFFYTFYIYRKYSKLFFYFDYVLEFTSKISLLLSLVLYNIIYGFRKSTMPRVHSIDCTSGYCIPSVRVGNDNIFDKNYISSTNFNVIRPKIEKAINITGIFCFFTLIAIISSSVLMWVFLNKKRKLTFLLKKYVFHLKIPFLSLICGISLSISLISSYSASETHILETSIISFWQHIINTFSLLSGVSDDLTSNFIAANNLNSSTLVIVALFISFYFGFLFFSSLLLAINPQKNAVILDTRKLDGPFDNFRLLQLQKGFAHVAHRIVTKYNVRIIRALINNQSTDTISLEEISSNYPSGEGSFKQSYTRKVCKCLCHALIIVGIIFYSLKEYKNNNMEQIISNSMSNTINERLFEWNYRFVFYSSVRYDLGVKKKYDDSSAIILIGNVRTILKNDRIIHRNDLLSILDENHIGKLFKQGQNGKLSFISSRYYIAPDNSPLLISFGLRSNPSAPLFSNFEILKNLTAHLISSNENYFGLKRLFSDGVNNFPDIVKHMDVEFNVVDSMCENKLYTAKLSMEFDDSGLLTYKVSVNDVLGLSIPHKPSKIFILGFFIITLLTLSLVVLLIIDIIKFGKAFTKYYPKYKIKDKIGVYFLNDVCRISDLVIIIFFACIIGCYIRLFGFLSFIHNNSESLNVIQTRLRYASVVQSIKLIQDVIIYFLTVRKYILIIGTILFELKFLYMSVLFYLIVTTFSLIFFFYFLPNDYASGFSDESFILEKSMKLVLSNYHFPKSFSEKSILESLLYPILWVSKILLFNIVSYFVWSIWPKDNEKNKNGTEFETFDDYKHFLNTDSGLQITSISEEQLEILHKDIKKNAAIETHNIFSKFEGYNAEYLQFGETKGKFIEFLHDNVANELADLLKTSNNLEFQIGILSKQNTILEDMSYKQLEDQILMLEEALADKSEELTCLLETYKR
ncbi:hypothetical protein BEWA_009650 [Theileria equi strain WA]|uniref:Uncharacterized protein n=1 Tax=Theileria equi strain WA TaxID=1537102 RepID=L0B2V0_THEEQ|nr:hypothetical protein BEWA_009650 [Theileria equi strain WA]AFZ81551.1 hypothetical protein BEWA_009650 [Theileria equi strain WA]|eukprot:XP_004831217.1 hypothetical protein BEWA_009650 [Theileria equi strain WA]